jgi:BirA family biotin operon repressor/biotin-[acetyl-CoA-carboxylase] ligase
MVEFLAVCGTIGREVRVLLPGDRVLAGLATGVDRAGQLLIRPDGGEQVAVSAGDVIHVRLSLATLAS